MCFHSLILYLMKVIRRGQMFNFECLNLNLYFSLLPFWIHPVFYKCEIHCWALCLFKSKAKGELLMNVQNDAQEIETEDIKMGSWIWESVKVQKQTVNVKKGPKVEQTIYCNYKQFSHGLLFYKPYTKQPPGLWFTFFPLCGIWSWLPV